MRVFILVALVVAVSALPNHQSKKHHESLEAMLRELLQHTDLSKKGDDISLTPEQQQEYLDYLATMMGGMGGKKREVKKGSGAPNVFFFLIDDLGFNDVSWHNKDVQMPNIEALRADGLTLENAYAQSVCSPSRGALMTGKYPFHTGMQHDVIQWTSPECAPLSETFLPERLREAGYGTYMLGKWHLGFCAWECTPTYRGFDEFFGFYQGYIDHYNHFTGDTGKQGYDWRDGEDAYTAGNGTYATDLLTERAISMINSHDKSNPMFMYFSHAAVHTPIQAPQKFIDMYPDIEEGAHHRKTFLAMASAMDDSIGQTIQAIKDAGMYDNSIIIFQSDNGGEFFAGSNIPLRGSKTSVYEAGTRVPVMFHSPLSSAVGVSNDLFHITDWHATILGLAGLTADGLDGIDQSDMLMNGGAGKRDEMVYNIDQVFPQLFGCGAIRQGNYKLIRGYPGLFDGYEGKGTLGMTHDAGLVGKRAETTEKRSDYAFDFGAIMGFIGTVANEIQLFDLDTDPNEENNIADANPDIVATLVARLDVLTAEAKMPDLTLQIPEAKGEVVNWGGIWTPGWCDAGTLH